MSDVMRIFLDLAQVLTPYGHEHLLHRYIPMPHRIDSFGNVFVQVGQSPTVMFASHMDTYPLIDDVGPVDIRWSRGMLATDGTTNLGADDRAGMALMIDMINHNVPGLYAFFVGEELGRLGSIYAAEHWSANRYIDTVRGVVAFDRRGTTSIITHQRGIETCPTPTAQRIASALNAHGMNYAPDPTGGSCDSRSFVGIGQIDICTNISVGFYDEHTVHERLDISHLTRLSVAARAVNWSDLTSYS